MGTTTIVTTPAAIRSAIRKVLASGPTKIAVAFWGEGALKGLGLEHRRLSDVKVICNLSVGACAPSVIRNLLDSGADVRALSTLHAKVYLGTREAVVGSANISRNGLGIREGYGWNEACVRLASPTEVAHLDAWFDELWDKAADMSDPHVARLVLEQAERDLARRQLVSEPIDLLSTLRKDPAVLEGKPLHITLDWATYSKRVEKKVKNLRKSLGADIDAWEDWKEMPAESEILSFYYDQKTEEVTYEGTWRTPRDPESEMDPETKGIFVLAAPRILQNYTLGNQRAWINAVRRFQQDLFAGNRKYRDRNSLMHITKFASCYITRLASNK